MGDRLAKFEAWVDDPEVWKSAVARKIEQQQAPLAGIGVPIAVLIGSEDRTTPPEKLAADLKGLNSKLDAGAITTVIQGAGHGLPWSHAQDVAKFIKEKCQ